MTAQHISRNSYYHIFNEGTENITLFNDHDDCVVFLKYLEEYLSPPPDPEKTKKTFSVNGKTFKGIPHQPKNYNEKVELLAFNLRPNHFHLIVNESVEGSLEMLMRSLSTRYAIYFNKKYSRNGSIFTGPYKSLNIENTSQLLLLTRHIHRESLLNTNHSTDISFLNNMSSYGEYLGKRSTPWIKQEVVLSFFNRSENGNFKGTDGYKNFVENYYLQGDEYNVLQRVAIEKITENPKTVDEITQPPEKVQATLKPPTNKMPEPITFRRIRVPEFIALSTVVFVLLFAVGFRNVKVSTANTNERIAEKSIVTPIPEPNPTISLTRPASVSGLSDESTSETEESKNKANATNEDEKIEVIKSESQKMVVITITDGSPVVNLREKPTTNSEKIGEAQNGDKFEYISEISGWYEFKMDDGTNAFVYKSYALLESEDVKNESN